MAIFGFKKRKDEKLEQNASAAKSTSKKIRAVKADKVPAEAKAVKKSVAKVSAPTLSSDAASSAAAVIIRPRITEKSGVLSQLGVYTFEVTKNATKNSISKAVAALYKVTPLKVAMVNTPARNVFVKGRRGVVSGMKKAMITLKKGDKIDFV